MFASSPNSETKRLKVAVPSLRSLCLGVLLPNILAKRDRYALMNLGPDMCQHVFALLRERGLLSGETMGLFMHSHISHVDLAGYGNTTQPFLDTIANLAGTLRSLSLRDCSKVVDFGPLAACRQLEVLDLSGTKLSSRGLEALRPLRALLCLRLGHTRLSELPRWLPEGLEELDVQHTDLPDERLVPALRRLTSLRLLNAGGTGLRVARLAPLKRLGHLCLAGCALLQPESLYWLAGCTALVSLDLLRTPLVPGSALHQLRGLTLLEQLALPPSSSFVAPRDFEHLAPLRRLVSLSLARFPVADLGWCRGMSRLAFLDLSSCPVADLRPLAELPSLAQLSLQDCPRVEDAALQALARLPRLASLSLAHTRVTDAGCRPLGELPSLTNLNLSGTEVGEAGLRCLASLSRLAALDVRRTRVAWDDLTLLQGLPLLRVRHDPRPAPAPGDEPAADNGGQGFLLGGGEGGEEADNE